MISTPENCWWVGRKRAAGYTPEEIAAVTVERDWPLRAVA